MDKRDLMEEYYDEYLVSTQKTIKKNDKIYYKVVHQDVYDFGSKKLLVLTIRRDIFEHDEKVEALQTTDGVNLKIDARPICVVFEGKTPEWYKDTVTVTISNISDADIKTEYIAPMYAQAA